MTMQARQAMAPAPPAIAEVVVREDIERRAPDVKASGATN